MRKNNYIVNLKNYIKFIPKFFTGSFIAFLVDNFTYSSLRPLLGINYSAIFAFLAGASTLFIFLEINRSLARISGKRKGFIVLLFIGIGSLIINIIFLNIIENILFEIIKFASKINPFYAGLTKLISSGFGFIWSSLMTSKYLYKIK